MRNGVPEHGHIALIEKQCGQLSPRYLHNPQEQLMGMRISWAMLITNCTCWPNFLAVLFLHCPKADGWCVRGACLEMINYVYHNVLAISDSPSNLVENYARIISIELVSFERRNYRTVRAWRISDGVDWFFRIYFHIFSEFLIYFSRVKAHYNELLRSTLATRECGIIGSAAQVRGSRIFGLWAFHRRSLAAVNNEGVGNFNHIDFTLPLFTSVLIAAQSGKS